VVEHVAVDLNDPGDPATAVAWAQDRVRAGGRAGEQRRWAAPGVTMPVFGFLDRTDDEWTV